MDLLRKYKRPALNDTKARLQLPGDSISLDREGAYDSPSGQVSWLVDRSTGRLFPPDPIRP